MSPQRTGTGGRPLCYQTAMSDATSMARGPCPYPWGTTIVSHRVVGSVSRDASVGRRWPVSRGRPRRRGARRPSVSG